jgi:hypothetical protein
MDLPIVVDILKAGIAGLAFLLLFMAFRLLSKEQEKDAPHALIIKTIRYYMLISLAFAVMVGMFDVTVRYLLADSPKTAPVKVAGKFVPPIPPQVTIEVSGVKARKWYLPPSGELKEDLSPLPDVFKLIITAPGYEPGERVIDHDDISKGYSYLGEITLIKKVDEAQLGRATIIEPIAKLTPLNE